jgi:hypothetical protein
MISRQWFVHHSLENVRIFVNRALSVDDEYVRIANGDPEFFSELQKGFEDFESEDRELEDIMFGEYERAVDTLLDYQEIVVRAALNEINAIVEYELKLISSLALSKHSSISLADCWIGERGKACKTIKDIYDIEVESLPGYLVVEYVRKMINAYKHDEGYIKEDYEPFFVGYMQKKYKLDPDEISKYVDAAKSFISALPGEKTNLGDDAIKRFRHNKFGSKRSWTGKTK